MTVDVGNTEKATELADRLGFKDSEEFVETAVETFLASRPDLRKELAAALYEEDEISLGRAVEISGIGRSEFKEFLKEKGIERKSGSINESVQNAKHYLE